MATKRKTLSLPAKILFLPWWVLNQPVYLLSRVIRRHARKGGIVWQFSSFTAIRITSFVVFAVFVALAMRHHWLATELAKWVEEYWRATLVYPLADATAHFFVVAEEEAIPEAAEVAAQTVSEL